MDVTVIPVNLAPIYSVLLTCAGLLASYWGIPKVIQLIKRR